MILTNLWVALRYKWQEKMYYLTHDRWNMLVVLLPHLSVQLEATAFSLQGQKKGENSMEKSVSSSKARLASSKVRCLKVLGWLHAPPSISSTFFCRLANTFGALPHGPAGRLKFTICKWHLSISQRTSQTMKKCVTYTSKNMVNTVDY